MPGVSSTSRPSRPAVGASVKLHLPNGNLVAGVVDGGSGFGGKKSPVLHFGLGKEDISEGLELEINWRDLKGQRHNQTITVFPGWQTVWLGDDRSNEIEANDVETQVNHPE